MNISPAAGPYEYDEIPDDAKVSGLMVKLKANGKTRLILNLSAPKGSSVNEGIDKKRLFSQNDINNEVCKSFKQMWKELQIC